MNVKKAADAVLEYHLEDKAAATAFIGITRATFNRCLSGHGNVKFNMKTREALAKACKELGLIPESEPIFKPDHDTLLYVFNLLDDMNADNDIHSAKAELAIRILQTRRPGSKVS